MPQSIYIIGFECKKYTVYSINLINMYIHRYTYTLKKYIIRKGVPTNKIKILTYKYLEMSTYICIIFFIVMV